MVVDCSALLKSQSLHTDVDSQKGNRVIHGLFAAFATCSELPFYHVALPKQNSG